MAALCVLLIIYLQQYLLRLFACETL